MREYVNAPVTLMRIRRHWHCYSALVDTLHLHHGCVPTFEGPLPASSFLAKSPFRCFSAPRHSSHPRWRSWVEPLSITLYLGLDHHQRNPYYPQRYRHTIPRAKRAKRSRLTYMCRNSKVECVEAEILLSPSTDFAGPAKHATESTSCSLMSAAEFELERLDPSLAGSASRINHFG